MQVVERHTKQTIPRVNAIICCDGDSMYVCNVKGVRCWFRYCLRFW